MSSSRLATLEPRIRRLVADTLGVSINELTPEVSLPDDLAVDSLDLLDLAIQLEGEFGVTFPERVLGGVRTYADLVEAIAMQAWKRREAEARGQAAPVRIWASISSSLGEFHRAEWLTPYTAETIVEDALQAGDGAHLDVRVGPETGDADLGHVQEQFSWLRQRGLDVSICKRSTESVRGRSPHTRDEAA